MIESMIFSVLLVYMVGLGLATMFRQYRWYNQQWKKLGRWIWLQIRRFGRYLWGLIQTRYHAWRAATP